MADSCECEIKLRDTLKKLQSHSHAASRITINQKTSNTHVYLSSANHRCGIDITHSTDTYGSFKLNPLCATSDISASMDNSAIGQFIYTCQCVVSTTELLVKMLTIMSHQNISDLSTHLEWTVAFTSAFSAFTSNQQNNLYYWVNAVNSDGASNEWIFIVISLNSQTGHPCFSMLQLSDDALSFYQETDMSAVMSFMALILTNKKINRSGYFK